jgi:hypothetical protein
MQTVVLPASSRVGARAARRPVIVSAVAGAVVAAAIVALFAYHAHADGPFAQGAFTTTYDQRLLDDPLEQLLVQGDGQAYASIARDPSLARPEVFGSDAEAAYRMQRPLLSYLAWVLSFGRSGSVPPALAAIAVIGAGAAVAGVAQLLIDRRASAMLAPLVLLLPGAYISLRFLGVETLALAFAVWGLVAWDRDRRPVAIALFALAALTRESLLLVPAALALDSMRRRAWRDVVLLALPFVAFASWLAVLRLRVGAWAWDAGDGRLSAPFAGLVDALQSGQLNGTRTTFMYAAMCGVLGVIAILRARHDVLASVIGLHLAFATTMGTLVWRDWGGFGRVLLPLGALSLVAIAGSVRTEPVRT